MNVPDEIAAIIDALEVLDRKGRATAIALLVDRLGIPESRASEILYVASHPDPVSLAGRI